LAFSGNYRLGNALPRKVERGGYLREKKKRPPEEKRSSSHKKGKRENIRPL